MWEDHYDYKERTPQHILSDELIDLLNRGTEIDNEIEAEERNGEGEGRS